MSDERYRFAAICLINEANADRQLGAKTEIVAKYLEQLANAAMEYVYELDGSSFLQEVISSFTPPMPGKE